MGLRGGGGGGGCGGGGQRPCWATGDGSVWRRREVDGGSGRRVPAAEEVAAEAGGVVGRREIAASGDGERLKGAPGGGCRG